jgi:hypothetical protein
MEYRPLVAISERSTAIHTAPAPVPCFVIRSSGVQESTHQSPITNHQSPTLPLLPSQSGPMQIAR